MKVKSALILCAGYGKRLQPITNDTPKSLLKIKNINLLDNTLNFVKSIGINNIKINTFYLGEKIKNFIENKNYPLNIEVLSDGEKILVTSGLIPVTYRDRLESRNDELKTIIVIRPDSIDKVVSDFNKALKS